MKKYTNVYIYLAILFFCLSFGFYFKYDDAKREMKQSLISKDSLQFKYDSINDALFSTQIELGRYEVTLEAMDSITRKKFEDYLYSQTE